MHAVNTRLLTKVLKHSFMKNVLVQHGRDLAKKAVQLVMAVRWLEKIPLFSDYKFSYSILPYISSGRPSMCINICTMTECHCRKLRTRLFSRCYVHVEVSEHPPP